MFFGMEWYWLGIIVIVVAVSIPFKIKFMKWWNERQKSKKTTEKDKWGGEE